MIFKSLTSIVIAALFIGVTFTAQAEVPDMSGASTISTFGELDQLRSQNAILTEAVKNAELKNKLNNFGKEDHQSYAPMNLSAPKQAQVELVSGFGNKMSARISLPTGGNVLASIGTKIPNLGVVKSISINNVVVEHDKQLISLPFADHSLNSSLPSMATPSGR